MTRRERLERKVELRQQWAASRIVKAEKEYGKADLRESVSGIPLGQPILVGHHSEGHHRRVVERADEAMRRSVEHGKMAEHHTSKAEGLADMLEGTIFSDDTDAAECLEKRIADNEARRDRMKAINKIIRAEPKYKPTDEKLEKLRVLGLSETRLQEISKPGCFGESSFASYELTNLGARIRGDKERLKVVKLRAKNHKIAQENSSGVSLQVNRYGNNIITFAEKPSRDILNLLRAANYRWGNGSWIGPKDALPDEVQKMIEC